VWGNYKWQKEVASIADFWRRAGVEAEEYLIPEALARSAEHRASFPGWYMTARDGDGVFDALEGPAAGSQNRWTGNTSGYEDARAQVLVDRFRQSMASEGQLRAVRAISDFVAAELPIMPMYYEAHQIGARRGIKAFDDVKGGAGPGSPYGSYARNAHLWEFR
jgi:hypothetical protein